MKEIIYEDQDQFDKSTWTLKKYNRSAFKELIFILIPTLKTSSKLLGTEIKKNVYEVKIKNYDRLFERVHQPITLIYEVINNDTIKLIEITPKNIWLSNNLINYHGCIIEKDNQKQRFKVDLNEMVNNRFN